LGSATAVAAAPRVFFSAARNVRSGELLVKDKTSSAAQPRVQAFQKAQHMHSVIPGLVAAVLWSHLLWAGGPSRSDLTPEDCKKALLEMMRSKPGQALGFFPKRLVDAMENVAVEKKKGEYHWTGAYRFGLPPKVTYVLFVGITDDLPALRPHPKGYLLHLRVYQGSFGRKDGRWIATVPTFQYNLLD
jgi:hypothetical protein